VATDVEERILIARAVNRDSEAFSELYQKHYSSILRCVQRTIGNRPEAQDITSDVFLRAWNAIDHFEDRNIPILTWLCTIARRLSINYLEKRHEVSLEAIGDKPNRDEGPEEIAERKWIANCLRKAVNDLPETQREVVSKRFFEHLDYLEIAHSLGKAPGTVRVINHRALRSLRYAVSNSDDLY
jgi:RNA polymerase sigma-70 factor (ECF subfamily)